MRLRASLRPFVRGRFSLRRGTALLGTASAVALAALAMTGALAQEAPESILPPGFGEPAPAANTSAPAPPPSDNASSAVRAPAAKRAAPSPSTQGDVTEIDEADLLAANVIIPPPEDVPADAHRSLDRVGLAGAEDGSLGNATFAGSNGVFLSSLMRSIDAPIASRWASITLRRALLSDAPLPAGLDGADWVGERAWLLLRMGEADNARALVARVDTDRYTPKLYDVAMQAALATADPASLCNIADKAAEVADQPAWLLAQAMCAGLSGEAGTASSLVNKARSRRRARGIDVLLAEKVIGAGGNTKRAVMIQWDGVDQLTAWRYGLAAATGVPIPPQLMASVGPQVQAWQARAPLYSLEVRAPLAERAAALGVLSNAALVDLYASMWDATDESERNGTLPQMLADAYRGNDQARLSAMRKLWNTDQAVDRYARLVLTARAAALVTPGATDDGEDVGRLIGAMLSAGLDLQAAKWGNAVAEGSIGWALLALSTPRADGQVRASTVTDVPAGDDNRRIRFLIAGLAGLGRLDGDDATSLAERYEFRLTREDSWTRALDRAVAERAAGTVALLAAAGMQTREWRHVPPEHLYRIVAAMRRVGLEPEARMIAAEAVARS